jgi:lipopolysaccharide export system permease protein
MNTRRLKIGGHIDRYVGSLFLSSYATALFLVVGLFLILDLASNLDEFIEPMKDGSATPGLLIVRYYLLNIPFLFLQVAPFVTLVAGLFTVSKLLKYNETTAVLGAGVSAHRLLAPLLVFATLLAAGMFELRESLSLQLAAKRDSLRYTISRKDTDQVYPHLFLKDQNGSVLHLAQFRPSTGSPPHAEVRGLEATLLSASSSSPARWVQINADRAVYVERGTKTGWRLENGVRREVTGAQPVEMLEGFEFTPELALTFHRAGDAPLELSYREAREMARRDPDNVIYQTLMQYHVTFPLANLVLLLVGLPLLMHHERRRGAQNLAAGCTLCVLFFATDFVFRNLGLQASLDPRLAAWMPILVFGSLGIVLYESMRT